MHNEDLIKKIAELGEQVINSPCPLAQNICDCDNCALNITVKSYFNGRNNCLAVQFYTFLEEKGLTE